MRVAGGDNKLNLNLVRSVEINCTCTGDSFEGTCFICWPSRDRVLISFGALKPRSCVNSPGDILKFVGVRLRFEKSSPRWRIVGRDRGDESLWNPTWIRISFLKRSRIQLEFLTGELFLLLGFGFLY